MRKVPRSLISPERYNIIMGRYRQYLEVLNDVTKDPVRVFDPLPARLVKDLDMIRELSRGLQLKKDEDMRKAAQADEEVEEDTKEVQDLSNEEEIEDK